MLNFRRETGTRGAWNRFPTTPNHQWTPEVKEMWLNHCSLLNELCQNGEVQGAIEGFAESLRKYANPKAPRGQLFPDYKGSSEQFLKITEKGLIRSEENISWRVYHGLSADEKGMCTLDDLRCAMMRRSIGKVLRDIWLEDTPELGASDIERKERQVDLVLTLCAGSTAPVTYAIRILAVVGAFADLVSDGEFSPHVPLSQAAKNLCRTFFQNRRDNVSLLESFRWYLHTPRFTFRQDKYRPDSSIEFQQQKVRYGLQGLDIWEKIELSCKAAKIGQETIVEDPKTFAEFARLLPEGGPNADIYEFRRGR